MFSLKQSVGLALAIGLARSAPAPAATGVAVSPLTPITFQNAAPSNPTATFCIQASAFTDNAPVQLVNCQSTFRESYTWTLEKPVGVPGPIHISGNKCLDVTNGANADGTRLQIFTCAPGNTNQMFTVNTDGTIAWAGTNKCVDVTNGAFVPGTPLQIFTCFSGNTNQRWTPAPAALHATTIRLNAPKNPNGVLPCFSAASSADGASALAQDCARLPAGSNSTMVIPASDYGQIITNNNKCLDVTNGVNADGTKLQWFTCNAGNTNQQWSINFQQSTGLRQIQWVGTNKCVDLTDDNETGTGVLQIFTCVNGNTNQQWFIPPF